MNDFNHVEQDRMKEIVTKEMLQSEYFSCCGWFIMPNGKIKTFEWNKNDRVNPRQNIKILRYYLWKNRWLMIISDINKFFKNLLGKL